jgi:hypothetical protein
VVFRLVSLRARLHGSANLSILCQRRRQHRTASILQPAELPSVRGVRQGRFQPMIETDLPTRAASMTRRSWIIAAVILGAIVVLPDYSLIRYDGRQNSGPSSETLSLSDALHASTIGTRLSQRRSVICPGHRIGRRPADAAALIQQTAYLRRWWGSQAPLTFSIPTVNNRRQQLVSARQLRRYDYSSSRPFRAQGLTTRRITRSVLRRTNQDIFWQLHSHWPLALRWSRSTRRHLRQL